MYGLTKSKPEISSSRYQQPAQKRKEKSGSDHMKRSGDERRGGVKWDEDNLEENERIMLELNPRKIDEPKTPYLSPMETDEELDVLGAPSMAPLSLDDVAGPSAVRIPAARTAWSDSSDHNGGSPSPRAWQGPPPPGVLVVGGSSGGRSASRSPRYSPRFREDYYKGDSENEGGDEDDPERAEKRRRFREARRAHYQMRAALLKDADRDADEEVEAAGERDQAESMPPVVHVLNGHTVAEAKDGAGGGEASPRLDAQ